MLHSIWAKHPLAASLLPAAKKKVTQGDDRVIDVNLGGGDHRDLAGLFGSGPSIIPKALTDG